MAGRPKNKIYEQLQFELVHINNKHAAICNVCKKHLFNTAETRLRGHRNVCKPTIVSESNAIVANESASNIGAPIESDVICIDDINDEIIFLESADSGINANVSSSNENFTNYFASKCSGSTSSTRPTTSTSNYSSSEQINSFQSKLSKNRKRATSKRSPEKINSYVDKLLPKDESEISEAVAQFFYGCNIPLSAVDSVHFENFIKKIRPAYADKIPGRKALSTTLLDNAYEKCLSVAKAKMGPESVLLIDGWKNSSTNSKTVVSMLHNAGGEQAFLEAWDLTGQSETGEKLAEIVAESVDLARNMYSTHVYAVVSDNASAMKKMGNITKDFIWKSNCSSHTANLLAKDVLDRELTTKVSSILKEFKNPDLERKVVDKGGTRMKLPCETRWCSHRDAFKCLDQNIHLMRQIAADTVLKPNIVTLIFDSQFIDEIKSEIILLDGICNIINKCQSSKCSAAEAVEMWIDLELPEKFSTKLKLRQEMALNKYALTAFYLHPFMDKSKLNNDQDSIIFDFLFETLDGSGLEDWECFRHKQGFFQSLYEKNIKDPLIFWSLAEKKFPYLAGLAKKLLQIPASSAQIERLFSSWAHVHCAARNRLTIITTCR